MDKEKIRKLWNTVIPEDQIANSDGQNTYKYKDYPVAATSPTLPILYLSKEKTVNFEDIHNETVDVDMDADQDFSMQTEVDQNLPKYDTVAENRSMKTTQHGFSEVKTDKLRIIPHYEVLDEIARGGMGVVFRGCQKSLQREIAIKKILQQSEVSRGKFLAESVVTAYLDHPNIVPVHELAEDENGDVFLAMKLVDGVEWRKLLHPQSETEQQRAKKYDLKEHLQILLNVCNAVSYAHSKNIVHCDLKPANVMVGEFGEVLVMDWGIAVEIAETKTIATHKSFIKGPMGTPNYMPQELIEGLGNRIGPWTDVYLLGGILYEILMKRPPRTGNVLTAIFSGMAGNPPEFSQDIPKELQQICLKAMAWEMQERYQSVAEFSTAIQDYLRHRESLLISQTARQALDQCSNAPTKLQDQELNFLYSKFSQAVSCFEQALQLWQGNQEAEQGQRQARLAYAEIALINEDFGLAEVQLSPLAADSQVTQLKNKINAARESKQRMQRTANRLRRMLYAAVTFIIVGLTIGVVVINSAYYEAHKQRELAVENAIQAQQAREDAEAKSIQLAKEKTVVQEQKRVVETQNENLEKQKSTILQQKKIVEAQNQSLEKQKNEIMQQKKVVEVQNENLEKQKNTILQQKKIVEAQNENLEKQKNEILQQKQIVEEERINAIQSSRIALRMLHKVFFEVEGTQRDPSIIQSIKGTFRELKRLQMLDVILANEKDILWLYGVIHNEIKIYSDLIKKEPNNYTAYYNRGCIYIEHGIYDEAIRDFSEAIKINPQLADAYFNRGLIYFKKKDFENAEKDFSSSIQCNPNNYSFFYYRAYVLLRQDKQEDAQKDLLQTIKLNPKFADAYEKLGISYFTQNDYQKAATSFKQAIVNNPKSKDAYYYLARMYASKKDSERVLFFLSKALENKFSPWEAIEKHPDFKYLRDTKEFQQLLDKYKR